MPPYFTTNPLFRLQDFYALLYSGGILYITILGFLMVAEARRKRLTSVLRWILPATLCATAALVICIVREIDFSLSFRFAAFCFFCEIAIGTSAVVLGAMTALRLRGMIRRWPVDTGRNGSVSQSLSDYDKNMWPPPPTGAV